MRPRPIRPNIYLPVARFGVLISDWKFVFATTLICYLTPFLFDLKLWGVPLELWTGLGSAALSIAFFNFARVSFVTGTKGNLRFSSSKPISFITNLHGAGDDSIKLASISGNIL